MQLVYVGSGRREQKDTSNWKDLHAIGVLNFVIVYILCLSAIILVSNVIRMDGDGCFLSLLLT